MAERRPIVIIPGNLLGELPAGDTLPGATAAAQEYTVIDQYGDTLCDQDYQPMMTH